MIVAAKILSELSELTQFVGSGRYSGRGLNPPEPRAEHATVGQLEQLFREMLGKAVLVRRYIEKLENTYVELLKSKEIDELEFARHCESTTAMMRLWLDAASQLLRIVANSELGEGSLQESLEGEIGILGSELKARSDSLKLVDAFFVGRSIPSSWNADLVARNMEARDRGEGTDVRDYLATLSR